MDTGTSLLAMPNNDLTKILEALGATSSGEVRPRGAPRALGVSVVPVGCVVLLGVTTDTLLTTVSPPQIQCKDRDTLPDVVFHINGALFPVTPSAYVVEVSILLGWGPGGLREEIQELGATIHHVLACRAMGSAAWALKAWMSPLNLVCSGSWVMSSSVSTTWSSTGPRTWWACPAWPEGQGTAAPLPCSPSLAAPCHLPLWPSIKLYRSTLGFVSLGSGATTSLGMDHGQVGATFTP